MSIDPTPREAIRDVLAAYCRGIDRRQRDLVGSCFHPYATDDHGAGPRALADFLSWVFELLEGYDSTFHILGQSTFDFRSDREAVVETYGVASHRTAGGADHRNLVTGFRYLDTFTDDSGWRIGRRVAVTDWSRVDREEDWWAIAPGMSKGRAGPDDPSFQN